MSQQQQPQSSGPPYASSMAALGGLPEVIPDVPICAVFIVLFASFAATNMTILQVNRRRGHKFILSGLMFGFSMARITTLVLRIAWATRQHNVRLAIAANIFVNAGILLIYIINVIFAQRILRAQQPALGWHRSFSIILKVFYAGIGSALVIVITTVVLTSYSLDPYTLQACRDAMLAASTYLLVFTTVPLLLLVAAHILLPRSADAELFGHGSMKTKVIIVAVVSCLCITIAGFKTGTSWMPPRPVSNPAWYHSKAAFYVFNFTLEISALAILTFSRVDKRFHIPNGSNKPGDYSKRHQQTTSDEENPREEAIPSKKEQPSEEGNGVPFAGLQGCSNPQEGCFNFDTTPVEDICPSAKYAVVAGNRIPLECGMRVPRLRELREVLQDHFPLSFDLNQLTPVVQEYMAKNDPLQEQKKCPHWSGWHDLALDLLFGDLDLEEW